jgi:uncharacterized protein
VTPFTVRQLAEGDGDLLRAFLAGDPANNLFMIGDLDVYGIRGRQIGFWGAFRGEALAGVTMLLETNACLYAPEPDCLADLAPVVSRAQNLSGELGLVQRILALLPQDRVTWWTDEYFCRLDARDFRPAQASSVRRAVPADVPLLADLYSQGDGSLPRERGQLVEHLARHLAASRYFLAQAGQEAVSVAAAVAETGDSAMIVAVLTAPAWRNRGYASGVVSAACADLLARGKTPHLFYRMDNPPAGRVYHKVGFHPIGKWRLVRLKPATQ